MKKIQILACLFFSVTSLCAQSNGERDRHLVKLSQSIDYVIYETKALPEVKEAQIIKIIGKFMANWRAEHEEVSLSQITKEIHANQSLDKKKISKYLAALQKSNATSSIHAQQVMASLGDPNTDRELYYAKKIFDNVGPKNLGNAENCETGNCDKSTTRNAASRGAASVWQWTGVKKYFIEDDFQGWRYLCELIDPNKKMNKGDNDNSARTSSLSRSIRNARKFENHNKFAWKTEANVQAW